MGVDPYAYLVAPRFFAGLIMIPLLNLFSVIMGILGGYLISISFSGISFISYFDPMRLHIHFFDLLSSFIKSLVFGILLITICCYKGLRASGGAVGVGKATTQSVVLSYILILVSDFFLTMCLHGIHRISK